MDSSEIMFDSVEVARLNCIGLSSVGRLLFYICVGYSSK